MARTPSKVEKACDTLLEQLNEELSDVEMQRINLYSTIRHIEEMRRAAIRSSASARSTKKASSQKPPDGLVGSIKEPPESS